MKIELATAASPKEVYQFMEKLEARGFSFVPSEGLSNAIEAYKIYEDSTTGEYRARVNVMAFGFQDNAFFEYSMTVETAARDAVTGELSGKGNSFDMVTQSNDRFTHALLFLDSVLCAPSCVGQRATVLNGD